MTDRRRRTGVVSALLMTTALMATLVGCTSPPQPREEGSFPVATPAPFVLVPPTASPGAFALVAMGSAVHVVDLPGGAEVEVTADGPKLAAQGAGVQDSSTATMSVTFHPLAGSISLTAADFFSRDENNQDVHLQVEPATATVTPGQDVTIDLAATYPTGNCYLTWAPAGKPTATWTFAVELD